MYCWVCLLRVFRYGGVQSVQIRQPLDSVPFSSWDSTPPTLSNTTQEPQTRDPDPDVTSSSRDVIVRDDVTAGGDVTSSAVNATSSSSSSPENIISFVGHLQQGIVRKTSDAVFAMVCDDVTAGGDVTSSAVNPTSSSSSPEISFTGHFQPGKR